MKANRRPTWAACAAIVALLLLAGCGGSDGPALSKEDFIAKADAICASGNAELTQTAQEQFGSTGKAPPRDEQEKFVSEVVAPNYEDQLAKLEELNPPEADQEQIDAMLSALQKLIDRAREDPGAVLDGKETEASRLAQEYGFKTCGS